jgi:uncharacterized protein YbaP (TraB family)
MYFSTRLGRRAVAACLASVLAVTAVTAQAPATTGKGFMWRIEREGRTGWLVGSIHVLTPDYYPLPDSMQKAFLRSVTLMEEIDLREMASPAFAAVIQEKGIYGGVQTLESELSKETFRVISERIERAGLPLDAFQRMRPWLVGLTLLAAELKKGGFDSAHGLDFHFYEKAPRMGKKFQALERATEQIAMFASLDAEMQEAMLRASVEGADSELKEVTAMANAWRAGDAATLERISLKSMKESPRVYQTLILDRNRAWLPKIEACLETGNCFIVVGAGHLIGADGLLASLEKRGYTVTQE